MDYMNRVDWDFFSYDSNVVDDECLFDTLGDTDSDVKSTLKTFCKSHMNEVISSHFNINSTRNKFDQLSESLNSFPEGYLLIEGYGAPFQQVMRGWVSCFFLQWYFC